VTGFTSTVGGFLNSMEREGTHVEALLPPEKGKFRNKSGPEEDENATTAQISCRVHR
jgi:hypothetical protein